MLQITSVQIISTTTLITIILLSSHPTTTEALPITSKPIESTVENLAWEAWLMVPVAQHQKSRKVTPKSIFIVPQKKNQTTVYPCPPGEHFYESRCIPTVTIDTEKILLTQLTNLVLTSGDYDYDYDEEEQDSPVGGVGGAEKLEGGGGDIIPSSNAADEPLKFDIFRDNFPIGSSGSGDSSGNRDGEDESILFIGERHRRPPTSPETTLPDLDTGSSTSYGIHNESEDESTLFLSGIDAILVPAVSETQGKDQNLSFSIYPEAFNATAANSDVEILTPLPEKSTPLEEMLEDESLILDKNYEEEAGDITTTERVEITTEKVEGEAATTTMKLEEDEDVESKTEFIRSVTEVVPSEQETTIPPTDSTDTTVQEEDEETTTIVTPDEETTVTAEPKEVPTTIRSEDDDITTTTITAIEEELTTMVSLDSESQPAEVLSKELKEVEPPPPVVAVDEDLKEAKKRQVLTTPIPSVEDTSAAWSKIIPKLPKTTPPSNEINTSSSSSESNQEGSTTQEPSPTSSTTTKTDPLWWLPTGWRVGEADTDRPLLVRFWSALSGMSGLQSQAKV